MTVQSWRRASAMDRCRAGVGDQESARCERCVGDDLPCLDRLADAGGES